MPNVPSHNIDRDGDHTGRHRDVEECLRTMGRRIADLEQQQNHMQAEAPPRPEA